MWNSLPTSIAFSSVILSVSAVTILDVKSPDSVKSWSKDLASSIINSYYKTRSASLDGLFYDFPVNQNTSAQTGWAESASIWDALIGYSHMTGDLQYNDIIAEALYAQMGPEQDFVLGGTDKLPNDEQSQWALTALSAAEYGFPKPIPGKPTFFNLARNVFSSQVSRWDPKTCNGGLPVFVGDKSGKLTSKNAHSASSFFLLGARLNKLTGENVFAQWAERQFEWAQQSGLIGKKFEVYDIMHSGCDIDLEISTNINLGRWMEGCAVMLSNNKGQYDPKPWNDRLNSLLDTTKTNPALYRMPSKPETAPYDLIASSDQSIANTLQYTRSLSHTVFWVPSTGPALYANITAAAQAATKVCAPATLKSGDKEDKISMACTADWRNGVKERIGQAEDKSVLAAAAALEVMQGVLWGMPKDEQPKETNMPEHSDNTPKPTTLQSTAKPEEPKQTQKPQDPEQTPKPADPTPTVKPEDPKQTTNAEPQPSQTTTQEQPQSSQPSDTGSASASPTTSGDAQPSVAGGSASRAKFGWMVLVSAFFCAALMV